MSAAVFATIFAGFVRNFPINKKSIPDNVFLGFMHNASSKAVITANKLKETMRLIRHEDNVVMNQDLLFSRLRQIVPSHRKNDAMPEQDVAESGNNKKQGDSDFQSRLAAALNAARAFHRHSSFE